jgi:nitrite reductase/ring-hydroxylating ferredoxin subunit
MQDTFSERFRQIIRYRGELPHRGYALKFGSLSGKVLSCVFHYAEFDMEDGRVLREPVDGKGTRGLKSYPVKVEGENILVLLEEQK